jgi:signal transduction histidine kinase
MEIALRETEGPSRDASGGVSRRTRLTRSWRHRWPIAVRYAAAILLVGLAWTTTFALRRSVDAPSFQTPFFVCAIVLSGWIGGAGPGLVATLLSIFAIEFAFTEPRFTFGLTLSEIPKFTVFFLTGAFISWLAGRQRRDEEALLVARENLEDKVRARTADLEVANRRLTAEVAERVRAECDLRRLNRAWRVRGLLNQSVAQSADEHELLRRVCQALIEAGGYRLAWIAFSKEGEIFREADAAAADFTAPERAWTPGGYGHGLAARAVQSGAPISCTSRDRPAHLPADDWAAQDQVKAVLALPLTAGSKTLGGLLVYSDDWDSFDDKETDLLQQATNDVAQGILLFRARAANDSAELALAEVQSELARVARLTTMGELTASIAHEINQPLAALVTNANACMRWLDRDPPNLHEAREAAQRIVRDGKRGSEVIARIRALLKKGDSVRSPISISEVVDEILALTQNALDGIELRTEMAPELPLIWADRIQIQQVLLNLILNAIDAMSTINDRPRRLCIEARHDGPDRVQVSVSDAGVGLPPDRLEKIFDTFFTTKEHGLGMGLAICRSIIERHGGRLWAEANPDHGATFRFTLPEQEEAR